LPVKPTIHPPRVSVVSARAAMPPTWVLFRMSTGGLTAEALVLGAGDALDGVAAGGVVASTSGGKDVTGEPTGVVDAGALAADEVRPGKVEPAALELAALEGDGEPDGVARGET
jgi:hypothetical protein